MLRLPATDLTAVVRDSDRGIRIALQVQASAKVSSVIGILDGRLKLKIAARPIDGAANAEIVRFISVIFGVSKAKVKIVQGESSKLKLVEVVGVASAAAVPILLRELE